MKKQAATQVLLDAVVAKHKKEREAVKRMAAEEQREEMVTVLGAPAAKRQRVKCEHGRRPDRCKECGGSGICEHGRVRSACKDCGSASICEHGRWRSVCKDCGGSGVCEVRARAGAHPVQGLRRQRHLQARACAQRV